MANLIVTGITLANAPSTISLSGADVVTIRRMLHDHPLEITLTAAITDTTTATFSVSAADAARLAIGNILEHDDGGANGAEQRLITDISGTTITAVRGHQGTTAQTHLNSSRLLVHPRFSYDLISDAYNTAIQSDLWPYVYNIVEHQITPSTTTTFYATPTANCEEFLNFYQQDANGYVQEFQRQTPTHNADTSLYATGRYYRMGPPPNTADTVYANCKHRYDYSTLSVEVSRAIQHLTCAYLLLWAELPRSAGPTNQGDRTVTPTTQARLSVAFRTQGESMLMREAARLRQFVSQGRVFKRVN